MIKNISEANYDTSFDFSLSSQKIITPLAIFFEKPPYYIPSKQVSPNGGGGVVVPPQSNKTIL